MARHWAGCCKINAIGLNVATRSSFEPFEAACGAPPCGCCCNGSTSEDGVTGTPTTSFGVDCVAGLCVSKAL